jgi:hypothetical protein
MPSAKCVYENVMLVSHYKIIIFNWKHMHEEQENPYELLKIHYSCIKEWWTNTSTKLLFRRNRFSVHVLQKTPSPDKGTKRLKTFRLSNEQTSLLMLCMCSHHHPRPHHLPFCHALIIHRFHYYYESLCICFCCNKCVMANIFTPALEILLRKRLRGVRANKNENKKQSLKKIIEWKYLKVFWRFLILRWDGD